jgi:hypothetical protein
VKWLDEKHGEDWAIWEFRAEGTGYPDSEVYNRIYHYPFPDHHPPPFALIPNIMASMRNWLKEKEGRVVVVHCKAGKGRSGTASCSYLISEEGWEIKRALDRFTERRMRPNMGKGVSIPSQLRWIGYVERWAKHGKVYVERQVEILEVHCWGLREGVKIQIEGFVNDGKKIKTFHTFLRSEREIIRGEIEKGGGIASVVQEVMGKKQSPLVNSTNMDGAQSSRELPVEEGRGDVVFRPSKRVVLPTNDLNIDVERRNKAAFDLTYVTAVAHVWINTYFEGNGPEQGGIADESGVFEITWEAMDGIKGSSRKGAQAFEKIAVVWKAVKSDGKPGIIITEPKLGEEVKQSSPADWRGQNDVEPNEGKDIGLRTSSPIESSNVSRASSVKGGQNQVPIITVPNPHKSSIDSIRPHGPNGEEHIEHSIKDAGNIHDPTVPNLTSAQIDGTTASKATSDTALVSPLNPIASSHGQPYSAGEIIQTATKDLPGGIPEEEMKDAKQHNFGHLGKHPSTN